ncbi:MAG TPA: Mur ligase domain-containing protein, partial [Cytophagaceae bacterium]
MAISISKIANIAEGQILQTGQELSLKYILLDSRKIISAKASIYFAIKGKSHDGHKFITELYQKGVKQFVIEKGHQVSLKELPGASIIEVSSSIEALQSLASYHRGQFNIPIIGITGSNGKTIVKEWLSQLFSK